MMKCFTLVKFAISCFVIVFLSTQANGSLMESRAFEKLFQSVSTFCLTPAPITCPDGCGESNECGGDVLERKTMAFLFTRKNPDNPEFLHKCGRRLPKNTNFNPQHDTEIFIHGWLDGVCRSLWMREVKDELLKRGPYNVIVFDWTWGNGPDYYEGSGNTYVVSRSVASLIQNIMEETGVGVDNFHLVGHSFGAQIAGLTGKIVRNLKRITALDPALEPFLRKPRNLRLDRDDARVIDVIHSNGGAEPGVTIGASIPLGDADFYPNGGVHQKSCKSSAFDQFSKLDVLYAGVSLSETICSHAQSIQFYKASIYNRECEFVGHLCADYKSFNEGQCNSCDTKGTCAIMGMDFKFDKNIPINKSKDHKYFLNTTHTYPFCQNSEQKPLLRQ